MSDRDLLWFLSEGDQRTVVGVHHFDPLPPNGPDEMLVERVNDLARLVNLLTPQLIGRTMPRAATTEARHDDG